LAWNDFLPAEHVKEGVAARHRAMVCLLSFAYATGLFSSQELAEASLSEPILLAICGGQPPFARDVRTFRRRNRSILERVLTGVFRRAVIRQLALFGNPLSSEIEPVLSCHAAERIETARQIDIDDD